MTAERVDLLTATPKTFAHLVAEASDPLLDAQPDGGWSARTILAHARDFEVLQTRLALERALAETYPLVGRLENARWERERNQGRDRKDWLLADFALQRQASANILRALRPEDWARALEFGGRGVDVSALLDLWLEHDAQHIVQLESAIGETLGEVLARRARLRE